MRYFLMISIIFFQVQAVASCNENCIAVIDAGSSGSRFHLYEYNVDEQRQAINIKQIWSNKISPGLSQLHNSPGVIDAYLTMLTKHLPKQVPVYFYATAGMRLLPSEDQNQYYANIKQWFAHQYSGQLKEVRTISGSDEGMYGWLSVNQQLGLLQSDRSQQVGVMDLGGASVQIAFPTSASHANKKINILNKTIYLNSHSFLGLGQTEVQHQLMDNAFCYANQYPMTNGELAKGDAQQCVESLNALVNDVHQVSAVMQSHLSSHFPERWFTMGSIVYTAHAEALQYDASHLTVQSLLESANSSICHKDWQTLSAQYSSDSRLSSYCLNPSYYYALISNGFGIRAEQVLEQLPDNDASDWTTGVILLAASQQHQRQ